MLSPATPTLAIERLTCLQRMRDIIAYVDVIAEKFGAYPVVQKRPLIENGDATVVPEHEPYNVEHRRWFKNHRVLPRRNLPRMGGLNRRSRRRLRQPRWIEVTHIGRVRFLPAGRILGQHGD